jgi:ABC-type sugar transport system substrate-binding protein
MKTYLLMILWHKGEVMNKYLQATIFASALLLVLCLGVAQAAPAQTASKPAKSSATSTETTKPAKTGEPGDEYPRPAKPARQYTIGVLLPQMSNPHFIGQAYGYTDEAAKLGAKIILYDAGGYQYIEKQVSQMEDLIASKVDAIDLVATNGAGTIPAVEEAYARGIPVINCNVMTDSDKVVTRVRSDDQVIGRMQADYMAQALHGKGNVVMLRGPAGTSWAQIRGDSFRKRLAEIAPGIKIVGEQYAQSTPQDGMRLMEDFLQTFPQIDGVYNGADMSAVGAAQVIRAAGKAGKIVITATDFQPDSEKFMREGVMTANVVQQSVTIGRWCIRATVNYLEKRPVQKELWTPLLLITKQNLDKTDFRGVRAPADWKPPTR